MPVVAAEPHVRHRRSATGWTGALTMVAFETPIGPIGVVESPMGVVAVRIGYITVPGVARDLDDAFHGKWVDATPLSEKLEAYARGVAVDFEETALDTRHATSGAWTPFRAKVTEACRKIPFGQVSSYRELAEAVGSPQAARAVGTVMARNCWPIVVPCHRILQADGRLGGFSSPRGLNMKRELLALEGVRIAIDR